MSDRYAGFVNSTLGARVAATLGLPRPSLLRRYEPGEPLVPGPVLVGGYGVAPVAERARELLAAEGLPTLAAAPDVDAGTPGQRLGAVLVDLTEVRTPEDLEAGRALLAPGIRALGPSGRVVVVGRPPTAGQQDAALGAARGALEGLVRTIGKELRRGATANLVHVSDGAEGAIESTLRFLLSARSAYVSGQVIAVGANGVTTSPEPAAWDRPSAGRVAVVTGAARGIGAAIAQVLARDGAHVVCVDLPDAAETLADLAARLGGSALPLDVTSPEAGQAILSHCAGLAGRPGETGLDVVVHNAGITRDRLLVNTDADRWRAVIDVNLGSILRMNAALLGPDGLRDQGRMVLVSSTSGIAGNRGQANYAASKAGIIGLVRACAPDPALLERGITVNAVAPGFIETEMTARVPALTREVGRRINSLAQGGLPVDVAEAIAYFAAPASAAVTGNVLRVCGQSVLGA